MTESKLDYSAELNVQVLNLTDQIRRLQTIIRYHFEHSFGPLKHENSEIFKAVAQISCSQLIDLFDLLLKKDLTSFHTRFVSQYRQRKTRYFFKETTVVTPNGVEYKGLAFQKGSCGVSIIRSGEAMEQGLRDCCRSIRIGKILIQVI